MKLDQLIDVTNKQDSIDTFESYSGDIFKVNNSLLIPFINLQLIEENEIIGNDLSMRVQYSYLIFHNVSEINWNGINSKNQTIIGGKFISNQEDIKINWIASHKKNERFELELKYKRLYLYIPLNSKYGQELWIPWNTSDSYKKNVSDLDLNHLFNFDWISNQVLIDKLNLKLDTKKKLMI